MSKFNRFTKELIKRSYVEKLKEAIKTAEVAKHQVVHETAPYIMDKRTFEAVHASEVAEINEYSVGCRKVTIYEDFKEQTATLNAEDVCLSAVENYFDAYAYMVIHDIVGDEAAAELKKLSRRELKEILLPLFKQTSLATEAFLVAYSALLDKEAVYMPVHVFDLKGTSVQ